ncbi:MAG: hypothetical protein GX876_02775 [Bacteroidales bacterium]|nr:hypothetical protein [Bacteroidales bacterium]
MKMKRMLLAKADPGWLLPAVESSGTVAAHRADPVVSVARCGKARDCGCTQGRSGGECCPSWQNRSMWF